MPRKGKKPSAERREPRARGATSASNAMQSTSNAEDSHQVGPGEAAANSASNFNDNRASNSGNNTPASTSTASQGPSARILVSGPPRTPVPRRDQDLVVESVGLATDLAESNRKTIGRHWDVLLKLETTATAMKERSENHWRNFDTRITGLDGRVEGLEGRVTNLERRRDAPARAPAAAAAVQQQQGPSRQQRKKCQWCDKVLSKGYLTTHQNYHCPKRGQVSP